MPEKKTGFFSTTTWQWLGLVLLTLLAAGLRLWQLGATPLWLDEAYNVHLASVPYASFIQLIPGDCRPPLYYYLLHDWLLLFGNSEIAARSLDALFGILTVPLVFFAGRALGGASVAWVAALLVTIAPDHVAQSRRAEMYTLFVMLGVLCVWAAYLTAARGRLRDYIWWSIATAALFWTHYWAVWMILGLEIGALLLPHPPRWRRNWLLAHGLLLLLILPLVPLLLQQLHNPGQEWLARYSVHGGLRAALTAYAGGVTGFSACLILGLGGFIAAWRNRLQTATLLPVIKLLLALLFIPLLAALLVSRWRPMFIPGRYTMILLPAFCWSMGLLITRLRAAWMGVAALGLAGVVVSTGLPRLYSPSTLTYRQEGKRIAAVLHSGDAVILVGLEYEPYRYYITRNARDSKHITMYTFPLHLADHSGWMSESRELHQLSVRHQEARQLANTLAQQMGRHGKVLVVLNRNTRLSELLSTEFPHSLRRCDSWPLNSPGGAYRVDIYEKALSVK
jgi:mannosyltransferase